MIAENIGEMRRQSPPSRLKNCIDACRNVRGCGQIGKKNMIKRMIIDKKLDICALSETKMKVNEEFRLGGIRCVKTGVKERCIATEGVSIMLIERMWSMVRGWKSVSRIVLVRIVWVRL
jgi:hypothetical protein